MDITTGVAATTTTITNATTTINIKITTTTNTAITTTPTTTTTTTTTTPPPPPLLDYKLETKTTTTSVSTAGSNKIFCRFEAKFTSFEAPMLSNDTIDLINEYHKAIALAIRVFDYSVRFVSDDMK
ncbi:hypothetical protein PoB_002174000 [Plakobranchus ocellatus]|uniref:SEA domain-containing protein n=1 Tax=Plakobranchus ocellatus TaxID=259542 RepID=A0AAV3ZJC3_9GAST|nr:hypothetical protein PoB_002174000 [Plakobranchus ocellatus]